MNFKKILIGLIGILILVGVVVFTTDKKSEKTAPSHSHIENSKTKEKDIKKQDTIEKDIKREDSTEKDIEKQDSKKQGTTEKDAKKQDSKKQDDVELAKPNKSEKKVDTPAHMQRWIEGHCYIGDGHNHPENSEGSMEDTTEEKDKPVKEKCPIQEGCDIVGGHGHLDEDEVIEPTKPLEVEDNQIQPTKPTKPSDIVQSEQLHSN